MPAYSAYRTENGHGDAEDDERDADGDGPAGVPQARRRHPLVRTTAEEAVPPPAAEGFNRTSCGLSSSYPNETVNTFTKLYLS